IRMAAAAVEAALFQTDALAKYVVVTTFGARFYFRLSIALWNDILPTLKETGVERLCWNFAPARPAVEEEPGWDSAQCWRMASAILSHHLRPGAVACGLLPPHPPHRLSR